jgi:hypothetical protein
MSWYNENLQNGFIDTTQEFVGGGGGDGGGGGEVDLTGINTAIANLQTELLSAQTNFTNISGDISDIKDVLKPKIIDNVNDSTDTIIVNSTPRSRIFLRNSNTTPKVKIEGGKLYLYYDYDFTNAPTIPAGWTDVVTYIIALKQDIIIEAGNIVTLDTTIFAPTVGLLPRVSQLEILATTTAAKVINLEVDVAYLMQAAARNTIDGGVELSEELTENLTEAIRNYRNDATDAADNLSLLVQNSAYNSMGANTEAAANVASALFNSKSALYSAHFANVMNTLVGAGVVISIIGSIYDLFTSSSKEKGVNNLILLYERIKNEPSANLPRFIHLDGLLIIENTNNGFSTFNTYKITLSNLAVLRIKTNGPTGLATIISVENPGGATFEVFNNIYIPKTQLGGTSGDLQIRVTSLISEVKVLANLINKMNGDMIIIQNRRRLREKVINTDEIGDGLTVAYNSSITNAETGEVLQVPTITLNYNTNQFETVNGALTLKAGGDILTFSSLGYGFSSEEIGGVLKVKLNLNTTHFEIIENVIYIKGYITASSLVPINTAITTLQGNVSDIETGLSTIESDILGINTTITDIQGDITGINTAITDIDTAITTANTNITTLQTDLTDLQTDVATILGVNSDVVDLLDDVATLKQNVIDINGNITMINGNINVIDSDIVDVNASLERVYKVLLPVGATMTSDYRMNLGFKEIYSGFPYDLMMMALKSGSYNDLTFNADDYSGDFLGYYPNMARVATTGNYNVYDTDQLAVNASQYFTKGLIYFNKINENYITNLNNKFEFVSFLKFVSFNNNTTDYTLLQSTDALGVISNTKLKVWLRNRKLNIKHPALVSYGIYNTGTVNSITTRLLGATEYFILEPITISGTLYDDKIRITSTPMGSGFDDYKYELKMLYVPWRIGTDNINKPVGFVKIVNANDTSQPNQDSRFLQLYLSHPSITNQPVASCFYPVVSYAVGIKNNGVTFLTPDWYIQKIVLKFDILFWETLAFPQPTLIQGVKSVMENFLEYTFRLRYSTDYINFTTVNFSVSDILGDFTTTGTTINAGFLNYDPTHENIVKRFLTYTYTIPNTYPNAGGRVRFVDFTLVKKPTWNYPSGANASVPFQGQAVLHLYEFNVLEYNTTPSQTQVIANNYSTADVSNAFSTSIFGTTWYLFALQLDLPNNNIGFYLKGIYNNFTTRSNYTLTSADITMPDPSITSITATFVSWANLMQQNGDLVIGNVPTVGSVNFTHFNWRFFQDYITEFLTLTEIQKLTEMINYGYYEEYVAIDKLLTAGEIITNNIYSTGLTINNKPLIKTLTDTIRARDLRTEQTQDPANVLIRLDNLYVEDPVASGYIFYDKITKTMTVGGGSGGGGGIGTRAEEDEIILGFIEDSAGYALMWDNVTNKLNVVPEYLYQDFTPIYDSITLSRTQTSNYVEATSNYLKGVIDNLPPPTPAYDDSGVYQAITLSRGDTSNYVEATSNYLKGVIDNLPPPTPAYDDAGVYQAITLSRGDTSNYVEATSNYLKGVIDNLPPPTPAYNDTAVYQAITTTSNILLTDFVARDAVLDTKITTTSNILNDDYIFRDEVLKADYMVRNENIYELLSGEIILNRYTDTKVATYLNNTNTKYFGGYVGIGTNNPYALLEINGTYGTLLVRDNNINTYNPRIDLIRGSGYFGDDGLTDWRLENLGGVFRVSRQNNAFSPAFLECFAIDGTGKVGIGTTSPSTNLQINGSTPTLRIVDTNAGSRNPRIELVAGGTSYSFGGDTVMDWRIETVLGNLHFFGQTTTASYTPFVIASNGVVRFSTNTWHGDIDGRNRFRFNGSTGGISYFSGGLSGSANARTIEWIRLYDSATLGYLENTGLLRTWGYSSLSDERIKKDIEDINDDDALIKILALKPKKYNYIEKEKESHNKILGFIAQEVAEIIPEAISKTKGIIPNIYKFCDVVDKRKVYHSIPQDLAIDTLISITMDELGEGKIYKIKEIYDNYFVIDEDIEYSPAFVKGYEVDDLHNVKKDMIFSLNVSATQELHKIIMEQKNKINDLETRLARLEGIVSGMLSGSN